MVDVSNPALSQAWETLKADGDPTNWVLFGYDESGKAMEVAGTGTGGRTEFVEQLQADKVLYGAFRCTAVDEDSRRAKFVWTTWVGESVSPIKRGRVSTHKPLIQNRFAGVHIDLHATTTEDLQEDLVTKKIIDSSGAHRPSMIEY